MLPTTQLAGQVHPAVFALIYAIAEQSFIFAIHFFAWIPANVLVQPLLTEFLPALAFFPPKSQGPKSPTTGIAIRTNALSDGSQDKEQNFETKSLTTTSTKKRPQNKLGVSICLLGAAWSNAGLNVYV
jgi:hypothetical protein